MGHVIRKKHQSRHIHCCESALCVSGKDLQNQSKLQVYLYLSTLLHLAYSRLCNWVMGTGTQEPGDWPTKLLPGLSIYYPVQKFVKNHICCSPFSVTLFLYEWKWGKKLCTGIFFNNFIIWWYSLLSCCIQV